MSADPVYKCLQSIIHAMSIERAYRLAEFISNMQYAVSTKDRLAVAANLATICGSKAQALELAPWIFRYFGQYLVDFLRMGRDFQSYYYPRVKVVNADYLQKVRDKGKGGIIVSAHIGNWELGGAVISALGHPFSILALPHKSRRVNDWFDQQRNDCGVKVISTGLAMRPCLDALKRNEFLAVASDRDFSDGGIVMNFLGRQTRMPKGAALFALKTGASLIPTFIHREEDQTFTMTFEKPIDPPSHSGKIEQQDFLDVMQTYIPIIESYIRLKPEQWLMFREYGEKNLIN